MANRKRKAPARAGAKVKAAGAPKQKITTYLWFDGKAEEAARFYVSLFKDSKVNSASPMMVRFTLAGQEFLALNGGPQFQFNESISLYVDCADQKEVDYFWNALTANGGQESRCGWLKDKFGLSWQIIPRALPGLIGHPDPARSQRAVKAMLQMRKIDIAALERA